MKTLYVVLILCILMLLAMPGCSCGTDKPPETGITPDLEDAAALAELRNEPREYLAEATRKTSQEFFALPDS